MKKLIILIVGIICLICKADKAEEIDTEAGLEEDENMHSDNHIDDKYLTLPRELGGHTLHLQCMGNSGPTIVFEAGWAQSGILFWHNIAKEVSKFAKVVIYDRAGYCKSSPGPLPRTAGRMADELHAALKAASIAGPYILVGHSLGGLITRMYEYKFPDEVVGLMLLDSAHEDHGEYAERYAKTLSKYWKISFDSHDAHHTEEKSKMAWQKRKQTIIHEGDCSSFADSCKQLKAIIKKNGNSLKNKPLVVIRAGAGKLVDEVAEKGKKTLEQLSPEERAEYASYIKNTNANWLSWQKQLAQLSDHSVEVVVPDGEHMFPSTHPEVVVSELRKLVAQCRTW